MSPSDLQFSVSVGKLPCVLDTELLLCHSGGPRLALRLSRVMEVWATRTFWPAGESYANWSGLLEVQGLIEDDVLPWVLKPDDRAHAAWMALREGTDAASWRLRWLDDCIALSQVGGSLALDDLIDRHEVLSAALDLRVEQELKRREPAGSRFRQGWCRPLDGLVCAQDSLVLSALLEGAAVLCPIPSVGGSAAARPIAALDLAGIPTTAPQDLPTDSVFHVERQWLRQTVVAAGIAPLLATLPPLAVLHVVNERAATLSTASMSLDASEDLPPTQEGFVHETMAGGTDVWADARAWWYPL
jgi:hypothetical protein